MVKLTEDLRPVEALYILAEEGKEEWDEENCLAATLVYLSNQGHIHPNKDKDGFIVTRKPIGDLRPYEKDCMGAISEGDDEGILDAVFYFDFDEHLVDMGYFTAGEEPRRFLFFRWKKRVYHKTEKYGRAVSELAGLKKEIGDKLKSKKFDPYLFSMSYAFPSTGLADGFLDYAKDVVDSVENTHLTTMAAIAAINMVLISNIIMNSMIASSSAAVVSSST